MTLYMITITANKRNIYIDKDNIDSVIIWLRMNNIKVSDIAYEISGLYKQLHAHALAFVPRGFRWSPYTQYGDKIHCIGFHIHWDRSNNKAGAIRYITKEASNPIKQDQIITSNYYKKHFFDIDSQEFKRLEA